MHCASLADLTVSNPTCAELPYAETELRAALAGADWLHCSQVAQGSFRTRAAIAKYLNERGVPSRAEQMMLTASSSESYAYLFKLLCDPGDVILVPEPGYPLLAELCHYESVRLEHYALAYDGAWHIDFQSLTAALDFHGDAVKGIVVVSPNNPTGSLLKRGELDRLLALNQPVIGDEVFASYRLRDVADACSVLDISDEQAKGALVFRLDGLSKLAALPQLKLGFLQLAGEPARVTEALAALEFIADTYLSVSAPVAAAAARLLGVAETTTASIRQRLRRNLANLDAAIEGTSLSRLHLEAGWTATISLPLLHAGRDWAVELLARCDVAVQPGWLFDYADPRWVVVSLLTPELEFARGIAQIVAAVARAEAGP